MVTEDTDIPLDFELETTIIENKIINERIVDVVASKGNDNAISTTVTVTEVTE